MSNAHAPTAASPILKELLETIRIGGHAGNPALAAAIAQLLIGVLGTTVMNNPASLKSALRTVEAVRLEVLLLARHDEQPKH